MRKVVRLLCNPKLATDEDGNLYRINSNDMAKPVSPRIHFQAAAHGRGNIYYYVQVNGQKLRFAQTTLKELQEKAVGLKV